MSITDADREFIRTADRDALVKALSAALAARDYSLVGAISREVLRRPKPAPKTSS